MRDDLLWTARAYAALAGVAMVALVGLAIYLFANDKRWFPLQRLRPGKWTGYEVLIAFCAVLAVPTLTVAALILINSLAGDPAEVGEGGPAVRSLGLRVMMVASPLTLAVSLAIIFVIPYWRSKTRPRDYGLSWTHWPANLALGIAAFLVTTPVVLGLHAVISLGPKDEHPFVELSKHMHGWEWFFLGFQTIVQAPVLEEILFRGSLLGWLRRASLIGHIAVAVMTIVVAIVLAPQAGGTPSHWDYAGPCVFSVLYAAGYAYLIFRLARRFHLNATEIQHWELAPVILTHKATEPTSADDFQIMRPQHGEDDERRRQDWTRKNAWLAVYGSAMLFAVCHTGLWPAPVALIVLALVLGWLALRTQSLISPITLHALFNLVSFIALYGITLSGEAQNGNVATTPRRPSLLGSIISSVPASQLPLRK